MGGKVAPPGLGQPGQPAAAAPPPTANPRTPPPTSTHGAQARRAAATRRAAASSSAGLLASPALVAPSGVSSRPASPSCAAAVSAHTPPAWRGLGGAAAPAPTVGPPSARRRNLGGSWPPAAARETGVPINIHNYDTGRPFQLHIYYSRP